MAVSFHEACEFRLLSKVGEVLRFHCVVVREYPSGQTEPGNAMSPRCLDGWESPRAASGAIVILLHNSSFQHGACDDWKISQTGRNRFLTIYFDPYKLQATLDGVVYVEKGDEPARISRRIDLPWNVFTSAVKR
jgi:hypothetical protein